MSPARQAPILEGRDLHMTFRRKTGEIVQALNGVSLNVEAHTLTALVGPDGGGKTTLIRLAAGLLTASAGELKVLGVDVAADPQQVQSRIGYMPQRFGLYEDLSVRENLDLYADMHGITTNERRDRYPRLMNMTALGPFSDRLAGRLSGGMKQKLGLACTLVRAPELLLLDEPTVGVDPLSRRELWKIIRHLVDEQGLTVLLSTSYLDEAERCGQAVVLHEGEVLTHGRPEDVSAVAAGQTFLIEPPAGQTARTLQARLLDNASVVDAVPEGGRVRVVLAGTEKTGHPQESWLRELNAAAVEPRFEDGFMVLLRKRIAGDPTAAVRHSPLGQVSDLSHQTNGQVSDLSHQTKDIGRVGQVADLSGSDTVVDVHDLVRKFGDFTAVDHISFAVHRGEIYGLLGPNGAGKTTTFRMICGLLPASSGTLRVAGVDLRVARAAARQRIGYVAQKFSLYGQLSVIENLEFFAGAYGLQGTHKADRIAWALDAFEMATLVKLPSGQLPGGFKQRLAMAAALLHEPEILFLDEPTSGADPLARREFWKRITAFAEQGVTVIVTTHFMEEAEYCDRVAIMDAGRLLAQGAPADIRRRGKAEPSRIPTMEDAFIAIVEESRGGNQEDLHVSPTRQQGRSGAETGESAIGDRSSRIAAADSRFPLLLRFRRIASLVKKESRQIIRDPSSIAVGIVLPVMMIILFGYALSLDVTNVPVAIVLEDPSPDAVDLVAGLQLSPYFEVHLTTSMPRARELMLARKVDGIVRIRPDASRQLSRGDAEIEILVHGTDANRARIIQSYTQAAIGQWAARRMAENREAAAGPVSIRDRMWFNVANESHYFLVPGLIVLVMTLIGAMLTAMVMAREWERGTLEALFVTPVRSEEILLGKMIPNFAMGMLGLTLCLLAAKFVFMVPFRGSLWVLIAASMLYLLVALGIGLLISSATKSQFVASQMTLLLTFLPAMMLSGFLFDLRSVPVVVRMITYALPARYFVSLLQTIFLAGDVWEVIAPDLVILTCMAVLLLFLAKRATRKKLA